MKTTASIVMLKLHFPQTTALPDLCIVQVSGKRRRAMGPCPLLWQNPSSELWQTPAVLLPPFSPCAFSLLLTALVYWEEAMIYALYCF